MLGEHCIKTWRAMIAAVARAKGLLSLAQDLWISGWPNVVALGTDSSAAKTNASRRG